MKKMALAVFVFAAVFLIPTVEAHCQGVNEPELKSRFESWYNTQSWSGGASYSGVVFDQSIYEDALEKDYFPMARFYSGWQPFTNLTLELSLGGLYDTGRSMGLSTGEPSAEEYQFYILPVQGRVRYSFMFDRDQVLVPSVWGGGDYWYFFEKNDDVVEGDKSGYHYGADIGILLDRADPASARTLKKEWNIDNTYLCLGYEHMEVGESEDGLRFSGEVYTLGVRFETYNRAAFSLY